MTNKELASKDVPFEGKTLKDICDDDWYEENDIYIIDANEVVYKTKEEIKELAIKWVKEDIKDFFINIYGMPTIECQLIKGWMKRLDITEEDLKDNAFSRNIIEADLE